MAMAILTLTLAPVCTVRADEPVAQPPVPRAASAVRRLEISEYRLEGAAHLRQKELEEVLAPYLGPDRELEDVEKARAALEKAYSDKGYQSVTVAIPPQTVRDGVVTLKVTEGQVGRLRVRGARYFLPSEIKRLAPSVAEGSVPNFNEVVRDIVLLNQLPDRRVTPALRAGAEPGTIDVDLNVQDTLPLHGSLEVNNRFSAGTSKIRVNGSIHYDNLWQLGHSLSFSFQVAPARVMDGKVFSLSYLARLPSTPWLTFTGNAVVQDSDVSTLGGMAVNGRGRIFGARTTFTLPASADHFHTVSVGIDSKRFFQGVTLGGATLETPVTYWPVTAQYSASWQGESSQTQLSASVVFNLRVLSSDANEFGEKGFHASGNFIYWRGELSRTQELPAGLQLFGKLQGQYSNDSLVSSEQLSAGGLESVRGYMESQGAGDFGALGSLELRSPSLGGWLGETVVNEWRFHAFAEGGRLGVNDPPPEQKGYALMWSAGVGSRFKLCGALNGTVDVGWPFTNEGTTLQGHPRVHFRLWSEF